VTLSRGTTQPTPMAGSGQTLVRPAGSKFLRDESSVLTVRATTSVSLRLQTAIELSSSGRSAASSLLLSQETVRITPERLGRQRSKLATRSRPGRMSPTARSNSELRSRQCRRRILPMGGRIFRRRHPLPSPMERRCSRPLSRRRTGTVWVNHGSIVRTAAQ